MDDGIDSAQPLTGVSETKPKKPRLVLVDGSGYIFRAYHALPPLTRPDGTVVNAVLGFCNILFRQLDELEAKGEAPSHFAVIFDAARKTFRNQIYPEYKAHRPEAPEDLRPQFQIIREATRAFSVACIEKPDFEADDIIATYAKLGLEAGLEVAIVSSDKDLMQLIRPGVYLVDPIKDKKIGPDEVMEKFGVLPEKVVEVQALCGDSTDNVPGVPGIGVKTAAQLITEYGGLDQLLDRLSEIKQPKRRETLEQNREAALISRQLVQLCAEVPELPPLEQLAVQPRDPVVLKKFLSENAFRSLLAKVESRNRGDVAAGAGTHNILSGVPHQASTAEIPTGPAFEQTQVQLLESLPAAMEFLARARRTGKLVIHAVCDGHNPKTAEWIGLGLSVEPGRAGYIPIAGLSGESLFDQARPGLDPLKLTDLLAPLCADPSILVIAADMKFLLQILARHHLNVPIFDDLQQMSYVLKAGQSGVQPQDLIEEEFGQRLADFESLTGTGKNKLKFDQIKTPELAQLAGRWADILGRLHPRLQTRLLQDHLVTIYQTQERPLIPVIAAMESAGISVDPVFLRNLSAEFAQHLERLEKAIYTAAGETFTIGSPKQLGEILFDKMSLAGGKKGKTGAYSTDADVLEALSAEGHELPKLVLEWRSWSKLKSTYTDALPHSINPQSQRIHTIFQMNATTTGRLSSIDPNLQNIPIRTEAGRRIREAFVAKPGHVLLSADYSQIELRLLAEVANIDVLKAAFKAGHDIHAITASQIFGVPLEGMDPMVRRSAKAINFGIIYGMSAFGLAQQLGIPQKQAQNYIAAYFERYPGIQAYMEKTKDFCRKHGFVETIFGRRTYVTSINDKIPARRAFGERAAINAPLQGSAADIIKRAMVRLPKALINNNLTGAKDKPLSNMWTREGREARAASERSPLAPSEPRAQMLLQVHDELVFEVPEALAEAVKPIIKKTMEGAAQLSVPLVVEVGEAKNWAKAH